MMNADACRERFARCLADEAALLAALEEQLRHEYGLLAANDIEGLEGASGLRQQTVVRLMRVHDERVGMCRSRDLPADAAGFAQLLAWCDPTGSLAGSQGDCAALAQRCREQNERNGLLVTARLNRVGGMLGMMNSRNDAGTYRPGAASHATTASAGRMVSTSA